MIGVGTTAARALESSAGRHGGTVQAETGETRLFIYPGFKFSCLDGLLTNFHLPRSTLLMLVCAFAGREAIFAAYQAGDRCEVSLLQLWRLHADHVGVVSEANPEFHSGLENGDNTWQDFIFHW